jgi:hypothetical protein
MVPAARYPPIQKIEIKANTDRRIDGASLHAVCGLEKLAGVVRRMQGCDCAHGYGPVHVRSDSQSVPVAARLSANGRTSCLCGCTIPTGNPSPESQWIVVLRLPDPLMHWPAA